jgi:hypothetical protein
MRDCTCLALVAGGAEAVDEGFELLDALALIAIRGHELRQALFLLRQIFFVITGVEPDLLVPDFDGAIHCDVEESNGRAK